MSPADEQGVTSGADLAAAYIIGDPAHVQRISVLSTSYGDCEAQPQSEANQFYVSLWQQAAVEGITVVVAAGDTGGDGCQYVDADATDGISVGNEASTPYNIAAGGTDFSDVFSGTTAQLLVGDQRRQLSERAIVYSRDDLERKLRQPPGAGPLRPGLRRAASGPTDFVPMPRNSQSTPTPALPTVFPCPCRERGAEHGIGPARRGRRASLGFHSKADGRFRTSPCLPPVATPGARR